MSFKNIGQRFQLRDAQSFFDPKAFKAPKDLGEVSNRLSGNVEYFQANYSILVGLVLMYVCYHQTSVFVAIALLGGIGYWLFNVRKQDIILSGRKFTDNELLVAFAAVVGTVLFYVGGKFLLYSLAFAGLLILVHASMKNMTFGSRATNSINNVVN